MRKLGLMIVGLVWAVSSASFAGGGNTIQAGPCVHLRTPYACSNYMTGECFWDYADQRCESRNNGEDQCSGIYSQWQCVNSPMGCFWDNDDQRCERR